jgi:TRAP-type C4-dicarboxylate transport system permease small subunit
MKYFALVMSALYVLVGGLFLFTDVLRAQISAFRLPLGLMLVAYGVVRAYLWRRKYADQTGNE